MLDRRARLVIRIGAPISAAMIIARVVLPRPGGAGQQHVVGGGAALPGGLEHQLELLAHPFLADELVEVAWAAGAASTAWSSPSAAACHQAVGAGRAGLVVVGGSLRCALRSAGAVRAVCSAARSRAPTLGSAAASACGVDRGDRVVGLARR